MSSDEISKPVMVLTENGTVSDESNVAAAAVRLLYRPLAGRYHPALHAYLHPKIPGSLLKPLPGGLIS